MPRRSAATACAPPDPAPDSPRAGERRLTAADRAALALFLFVIVLMLAMEAGRP